MSTQAAANVTPTPSPAPTPAPTQAEGDGAGKRSPRFWVRVQALSGLTFLVFAALHLANTALAALGPAVYNGFQRTLRPIYQYPAVELALVLAPIVVHIAAGIVRMRQRKGLRAPTALRARVHRYAGYFLMLFIVGHVGATRLPPLLAGAYPEFEGVAFTFQFLPLWFYPYYFALGLAGLLHAAIGTPLALAALGLPIRAAWRRGARFWAPVSVAAVCVVLGVAALGGLVYAVPDYSLHPFSQLVQKVVHELLVSSGGSS